MNREFDCFEIASAGEPAHLREFQLTLDGRTYVIKFTFPRYLQELRERNANRLPSARVDENIYVFHGVDSTEQLAFMSKDEVCQRLHRIPFETLHPYLIEQTDE